MLSPSGVTLGHVVRPSDLKTPRRIVFIQCVGARGEGGRPYCSRFCCMNAVKDSMLLREHDRDVEDVTILHTDLRAFGKGFDDFVQRSRDQKSANYVRGRPAKIDQIPGTEDLEIFVEDTLAHEQKRIPADLVVLSVAAAPSDKAIKLAETLQIETDQYGFVAPRDPAVSAVETTREGVGVFVCSCGINIAGLLDVEDLAEYAGTLPEVVVSATDLFACSSTGQAELGKLIVENKLTRVVVAACTPRTHEPVFRAACSEVGLNPYLMEMVNIRDQCSWVHAKQPEEAQEKARSLIRMGVARAFHLAPLEEREVPMTHEALVIGGGIAGIQAATDLAEQGFPVTLVEKADRLGGRLAAPNLKHMYPNMRSAAEVLQEKLERLEKSGARILVNTEVEDISGYVGNFEVRLSGATDETFGAGAIILAIGASLHDPQGEYGYGEYTNVITSQQLE